MSLSDQLIKRLDTELEIIRVKVMSGQLEHEHYKFQTGKAAGLELAKLMLQEVLFAAKNNDDDDDIIAP